MAQQNRSIEELISTPNARPAVLLSTPALPLLWITQAYIEYAHRSIDEELMHLQRREILWTALLRTSVRDQSERDCYIARLGEETDQRWRTLWMNRPID